MTIYEHLTTFAGLPVVDFAPDGTMDTAGKPAPPPDDPTAVAWRVWAEEDDNNWEERPSPAFLAMFEAFLASPAASVTTALVLGAWGYAAINHAPVEAVRAAAPRLPALRHLFFGDMTSEECEISWIKQGDVSALLEAYPDLRTLRVRGTDSLVVRPVRHASLRELAFESGGLPGAVVRAVGECDLPALSHLELWLGTDNYGGDATVEDLAPVLSGARLPALTHLGLRDAEIADLVAAALAGAPVVARLRTLDLSLGILSDVGATALLAGQPLTHLRRLDLHHHYLSEPVMARLKAELEPAGVELDLSDWERNVAENDRFVAVSE
jgi:hypothetical protein